MVAMEALLLVSKEGAVLAALLKELLEAQEPLLALAVVVAVPPTVLTLVLVAQVAQVFAVSTLGKVKL